MSLLIIANTTTCWIQATGAIAMGPTWPRQWVIIAIVAAVGLMIIAKGWQRLGVVQQKREAGTATLEFVLVLPVVLFLALLLVQVTLMFSANFVVQRSAFAATRAAIVYLPQTTANEDINEIYVGEGSEKYNAIHRAAWLSLIPVSGREVGESADGQAIAQGLEAYFDGQEQSTPRWVNQLIPERTQYAMRHTFIELMRYQPQLPGELPFVPLTEGAFYEYGPRDAVAVRVSHELNLSVPYVRALFADGRLPGNRGAYANVSAVAVLNNQGIDPTLPQPPEVPRLEPGQTIQDLLGQGF